MKNKKVTITLQNGKQFEGVRFGADGDVIGELVFNTSMTGYLETITNPENYGQIVMQTFPLIGNYGVTPDAESKKPWVSAFVVREKCDVPSNFRCQQTLEEYMKKNGVVGVYGIDTRELTKIIRENGAMNAVISSKPASDLTAIENYEVKDAVKTVTCGAIQYFGEETRTKVVVWDFGVKNSLIQSLVNRGLYCIVVPANTTAEQILALDAKGLVLSNGPGDPAACEDIVNQLKRLIGKMPIFAVGLGHQLFALAMGGKTKKMKFGHHGGQPVKDVRSGRVYITAQNHGYEVVTSSLDGVFEQTFVNANDGSCEGLEYASVKAISVQFQPGDCNSPSDPTYLYDSFVKILSEVK